MILVNGEWGINYVVINHILRYDLSLWLLSNKIRKGERFGVKHESPHHHWCLTATTTAAAYQASSTSNRKQVVCRQFLNQKDNNNKYEERATDDDVVKGVQYNFLWHFDLIFPRYAQNVLSPRASIFKYHLEHFTQSQSVSREWMQMPKNTKSLKKRAAHTL